MDSVVGIDLSGLTYGAKGRTVAAHLYLETPLRLGEPLVVPRRIKGDRILVDWIEERRPKVVAIDAPLSLPHSILCVGADCPRCELGAASYLERDVDREARRQGGGMPTVMLAAIAFRGIYLARKLRERGYEVIETYPRASLRALGAAGSSKRDPAGVAAALARRVEGVATSDPDELDAIAAALAAADYLRQPRPEPIEASDGTIWIATAL